MHSLFEDSKRRSRDLRVVWFNLQNAFESIPHSIMFEMIARLGIPPAFITLCRDIYTDSKFSIRTSSGLSPPITQSIKIKQGCPMSRILFNLSLQGLLEGFDKVDAGYRFTSNSRIRYLAYADDLCIFGNSKSDITSLISVFKEFLTWSRLSIKPAKCCSL